MKLNTDQTKILSDVFKSLGVAWIVAGGIVPALRPTSLFEYIYSAVAGIIFGIVFIATSMILVKGEKNDTFDFNHGRYCCYCRRRNLVG